MMTSALIEINWLMQCARQGANAARIIAWATHSQEPSKFTSAPVPAIQKVLQKAGWSVDDVDLCEINEALAMVPMIAMKELNIPTLEARGLKRGVASLSIGGGEGTAIAIERP